MGVTLTGILYLHRISDIRVGGAARKNFDMFRKLCGDDTLKNVTIVTTMWGEVDSAKGAAREGQLRADEKFFKLAIDNDAQLVRHDNTLDMARAIIWDVVQRNSAAPLCVQKELVTEGKNIIETSAGKELDEVLVKQIQDQEKLLEDTVLTLGMCLQELEDERKKKEKAERERANLVQGYAEELARLNRMINELRRAREHRGRFARRFSRFAKKSPLGYLARAVRSIFTEVVAPVMVQDLLQPNDGQE